MSKINDIKNRLLFLSPVVQAGWEREATIDDFEKTGDLGSGAFGTVGRYKHKKSGIVYALKQMKKSKLKEADMVDQIKNEIKIMYSLQHDHIIKLYNHFEEEEYIYLVLEYANGGQLWQKLHTMEGKRFPEKMVAQYIKDLALVLEFLHGRGIIHRDIKPENILLDKSGRVKLADFGWSNFLKPNVPRTTFCGTLDYLPPEMLTSTHVHDQMVDIWAVGVLTYELLSGKAPFSPADATKNPKDVERQTQENIAMVKYEFPKEFPPLAKDMVSKILKRNPKTRISLQEIKTHPWIKLNAQASKLAKEESAEKALENINFGKNMAEQKKILKDGKTEGYESAFTEDEIIEITRPDSLLEKDNLPITSDKYTKLDSKVENFKKNMGAKGEDAARENELKKSEDDWKGVSGVDSLKYRQLLNENKELKRETDQTYKSIAEKEDQLKEYKLKLEDIEDKYKKLSQKNKAEKSVSKDKESTHNLEAKLVELIETHITEKNNHIKKIRALESQISDNSILTAKSDLVEQNKKLVEQLNHLEALVKSRFG